MGENSGNSSVAPSVRHWWEKHAKIELHQVTKCKNPSHLSSAWSLDKSEANTLWSTAQEGFKPTWMEEMRWEAEIGVQLRWSHRGPSSWRGRTREGKGGFSGDCGDQRMIPWLRCVTTTSLLLFNSSSIPCAPWKLFMAPFYPLQMAPCTKLYWGIRICWLQYKAEEMS